MWQPSRQTNQQTKVQLSKSSSKVFKTPEAPGDFWLWDKFLTFWEPVATHQVMKILFQAGLGPKNLEDFLDAKICPIMLSREQKATKIEWFFSISLEVLLCKIRQIQEYFFAWFVYMFGFAVVMICSFSAHVMPTTTRSFLRWQYEIGIHVLTFVGFILFSSLVC